MMTNIPIGTIVMFSGKEIPQGWLLCDGKNGTPDLRNKFILGGTTETVSIENSIKFQGSNTDYYIDTTSDKTIIQADINVAGHKLTINEMPSHTHDIRSRRGLVFGYDWNAKRGPDVGPVSYRTDEYDLYNTSVGGSEEHKHSASLVAQVPHSHNVKVKVPYYVLSYIIYAAG